MESHHVQIDPDKQVQQAVRLLFDTFRRTGTAHATLMHFSTRGLKLSTPPAYRRQERGGDLGGTQPVTRPANSAQPALCGAFSFGRTRTRIWPDGEKRTQHLPVEEWLVLIPNLHVGYISWEEYQENQRRLQESAQARGATGARARRAKPGFVARAGDLRCMWLAYDSALSRGPRRLVSRVHLSKRSR